MQKRHIWQNQIYCVYDIILCNIIVRCLTLIFYSDLYCYTCCFCRIRFTLVKSCPVSAARTWFSNSVIQLSISSQVCMYKTCLFASKSLSAFSFVADSKASNCCSNSDSWGYMARAQSGFSLINSSPLWNNEIKIRTHWD